MAKPLEPYVPGDPVRDQRLGRAIARPDLHNVLALDARLTVPVDQGGTGASTTEAMKVTAAGTTTARTLAARFADVLNVKDFGAVCDGVTDDGPAIAAMIAALGATNHTIIIPGNCVTNQALVFPANLEVRFRNNGVFLGTGAVTYAAPAIHLTDKPGSTAHLFEVDHYGDTGVSAYAIDIQNYADNGAAPTAGTGARHAIVIHQYSDASGCAALQIDNTRSQPFIVLKQSKNEVHSAGQHGVGDFFQLWGYSATAVYPANDPVFLGKLDHLMTWRPADTSRPWTYRSDIACVALKVVQTAVATGLEVSQAENSIGVYVHKDGTGAGDAFLLVNKGTGPSLRVSNGTTNTAQITAAGMVQFGMGNTAAPPTAADTYAGMLWYRSNGVGAKDDVLVCAKDATNTWAWRVIY